MEPQQNQAVNESVKRLTKLLMALVSAVGGSASISNEEIQKVEEGQSLLIEPLESGGYKLTLKGKGAEMLVFRPLPSQPQAPNNVINTGEDLWSQIQSQVGELPQRKKVVTDTEAARVEGKQRMSRALAQINQLPSPPESSTQTPKPPSQR